MEFHNVAAAFTSTAASYICSGWYIAQSYLISSLPDKYMKKQAPVKNARPDTYRWFLSKLLPLLENVSRNHAAEKTIFQVFAELTKPSTKNRVLPRANKLPLFLFLISAC